MKALRILLVLLSLLALASCDRFSRDEEEIDFNQELFAPLALAMQDLSDTSTLMSFYHEDYLHNATDKAARDEFYHSIEVLYGTDITLNPVFSAYNPSSQALSWELRIEDASAKSLAVISFTEEKLVKVAGKWLFYGNQISDLIQGERQRIIYESFTFTTCPNCPQVEALMHSLASQYPAQFSYLEYHIGDPLAIPANNSIFAYYGVSPMPATVFQGIEKRIGSNPEVMDAYVSFAMGMLNATPQVFLEDLEYSFAGMQLDGSIMLRAGALDQTDLKLRYHLIEKVSSATNSVGAPCTNVVLASGTLDISGANLNQPVSFSLPFTRDLPSDTALVLYVQKMPAVYASNAPILNGIELPINTAR